jgi:alpha-1,6-mannosyltransferase
MTLLEDMGWVTLVLMLYGTSWLMPWYVSILYPIAAVLPTARLFGLTVLMFGVSSAAMYSLQADAGLRSLVAIGLPTWTMLLGAWVLGGEKGEGERGRGGERERKGKVDGE